MGYWNDGGLPYGARKVKFFAPGASDASGNTPWNGTSGIYILESFTPTRGQVVIKRKDEAGQPNGSMGVDDFVEASAVVQFQYASTPHLDNGAAFTSLRPNASAESWVVISNDEPEAQLEVKKQSVRLQKIVNSPSGNLPAVYP